jgi:hypothetical protein
MTEATRLRAGGTLLAHGRRPTTLRFRGPLALTCVIPAVALARGHG